MTRVPALSALYAMALALTPLSAQAPPAAAADTILGVRIGMTLDEAQAQLGRLGTRAGRELRDGGHKEAWTLKATDYGSVALRTDARGRVVWITGFRRAGQEAPFSEFGDLSRATLHDRARAVWDIRNERPGYRLMVRGNDGKAQVVTLLAMPPGS
jgi:hypothetical protein